LSIKDVQLIDKVIAIFDSFASYDPHGVDHKDGSRDGVIKCMDSLRKELNFLKWELTKDD